MTSTGPHPPSDTQPFGNAENFCSQAKVEAIAAGPDFHPRPLRFQARQMPGMAGFLSVSEPRLRQSSTGKGWG
jgi:hypothetical protein